MADARPVNEFKTASEFMDLAPDDLATPPNPLPVGTRSVVVSGARALTSVSVPNVSWAEIAARKKVPEGSPIEFLLKERCDVDVEEDEDVASFNSERKRAQERETWKRIASWQHPRAVSFPTPSQRAFLPLESGRRNGLADGNKE